MELKELIEALNAANEEIKQLKQAQSDELKANGVALEETKTKLAEAEAKAAEMQQAIDSLSDEVKALNANQSKPTGQPDQVKSVGQKFVESDVFEELKSSQRGNNSPVTISRKDITGAAASAGALQPEDRDPEVYRSIGGRRALRVRDLIPFRRSTSGSVEIMRQTSFTNSAAPQSAELAAKAQSGMAWELVSLSHKTIAHWEAASRQALSDAPMLQGLIDTELSYGLELEMDDQLMNGDGTGQNMLGFLNDPDVNDIGQIAAGTTAAQLPAAMIDHIRAAVTQCQVNEYYNVNGLILNPVDWETLETAKATDGHYILVPFAPSNTQAEQIWRVPVVVTNAISAGNFILGDWVLAAKLYGREDVSIRVSESHADYFIRNGVAVLAEERAVLGINRPKALTKGAFTVAI